MKKYICPKCGRGRHPEGRKCPDCGYIGRPKPVEEKVVSNPTIPHVSAPNQTTYTVPISTVTPQSQVQPVVVVLDRGEKKSEPEGLTALQTLLLLGIILVGAAVYLVWRDPSLLTRLPSLPKLPALVPPAQGANVSPEPTLNPQPILDEEGKVTGCAEGGVFIEFVGGNPNFLGEKGAVIPERLPKVGETPSWYCFDPQAWKKWIELPVPRKDYDNVQALTMAIMKASSLNSQAWKDAIKSALQTSIGQSVLVLPAKTKQEQVSVPPQPQQPSPQAPPAGGSDLRGQEGGGGAPTETPFPPATDTPEPTPTLSPEEAEKLQVFLALEANLGSEEAQKAQANGDDEAVFKLLGMDLSEILGMSSAQAKVMPILSPDGLFIRQKASGEYYAVSARRALDGRALFKTDKLSGFTTTVPSTNGGTWKATGGEIHWEQQLLSSGDPNVWGSDSRGFEVPWISVWVYPVDIPQQQIPGAPTPTIDIRPIITAVQAFIPTSTVGIHNPPPPAPTQTPPPTATPTPTGVNQLEFVSTIYAAGLNTQGWYGAMCTKFYWVAPGYVATCNVGGSYHNVSFWVSALNVNIDTNRFWYSTDGASAPGCWATLPKDWFICLVP